MLTFDARSSVSDALAIDGERIVAMGEAVARSVGPDTTVVELAGRTVMPGLTDGHAHLDREGLKGLLPSLAGCDSIRDLVERIRALAAAAPKGAWVVTMPIGVPPEYRYSDAMFAEGRLPDRFDLDQASIDHPLLIRSAWGYWSGQLPLITIANSAALAAAGIARGTASPSPLVTIETDADGEPTGRIFDNAYQPITEFTLFRHAPQFTLDDRVRTLGRSMQLYNAVGTTAVFEGHGAAPELIAAHERARARRGHTVRTRLTISKGWTDATSADIDAWVRNEAPGLRGTGIASDAWLGIAGVFAEPEAAPAEARLRAACAPRTGWAGFCYDAGLPPAALATFLAAAARERLRVAAIGAPMLEAFAAASEVASIDDLRWVIAHPQTLDTTQIARIRDLGVVITTHTNGAIWKRGSDMVAALGAERANTIVPIRALLEAGVTVSFGTDNVPVSLWHCIWQAVERIDRKGAVIGPEQRISRADALRAATVHGARLCLEDDERGTLEPGRLADLIVLPEDPLTIAPERLRDLTPDLTIVGGRIVWRRGDSAAG